MSEDAPYVLMTDVFDESVEEALDHISRRLLQSDDSITDLPPGTPILVVVPAVIGPVNGDRPGWDKEVSRGRDATFVSRVGVTQIDRVSLFIGDKVTPDMWRRRIERERRSREMVESQVSGLRSKLEFLTKQNEGMKKALLTHGLEVGRAGKITVRAGNRRIKI